MAEALEHELERAIYDAVLPIVASSLCNTARYMSISGGNVGMMSNKIII